MIEIGDRIEDPRVGVAGVTVTAAYRVWVAEWLPLASGTPVSALDVLDPGADPEPAAG
jgi:hypothetical protein